MYIAIKAAASLELQGIATPARRGRSGIKALITRPGKQVGSGAALVGETSAALLAIVANVQEISKHVGATWDAAREQAVGLQQFDTAVSSAKAYPRVLWRRSTLSSKRFPVANDP